MKKIKNILTTLLLLALLTTAPQALTQTKTYRVKSGDNLAIIARQFDLSLDEIVALNNIRNANDITIGQILNVSLDNLVIIEDAIINRLPSNKDPISKEHSSVIKEVQAMLADSQVTTSDDVSVFTGALWPTAYPQPINNITFSTNSIVQGESFGLTIELATWKVLHARFVGQEYPFFVESDTVQNAILAVPVSQKAGIYPLDIEIQNDDGTAQNLTLPITINALASEEEFVKSLPISTSSIGAQSSYLEEQSIRRHCAKFDAVRHWDSAFRYPINNAPISSAFGNNRIYKGSPASSAHQGLDFRAQSKTSIYASGNGIVRLAQDLNIRGNTLVIDHGMGLCTIYSHLNEILVAEGDKVSKDDIIAKVGSTGLVNHTHLHWELRVMGIPVNPTSWVQVAQAGQ